jgi:hypothetical protein
VVVGVQRRACQLAVEGGPLLILSAPDVPLAPNALAVQLEPGASVEDAGLRTGQTVTWARDAEGLHAGDGRKPSGLGADWLLTLGTVPTWEPRPGVPPVDVPTLVDRWRTARATAIAEGAAESLLPLLWTPALDGGALLPGAVRGAAVPARRLGEAAIGRDTAALSEAARGLAGLGPGLTPSGDDLLAGFAGAWTLIGEALGVDGGARDAVATALLAGAEPGASPLGRAWLAHACRGELAEPMSRLVVTLLDAECGELAAATRGVLAIGASSGIDWMVGFLLAVAALSDAAAPGRPW